jgi:hypothetical protein
MHPCARFLTRVMTVLIVTVVGFCCDGEIRQRLEVTSSSAWSAADTK